MALKNIIIVTCGLLVVSGALYVWYSVLGDAANYYQEATITWQVTATCLSASTREPLPGASVTAILKPPHPRNVDQTRDTRISTNANPQGRFVVIGRGGSIGVKVEAEGYHPDDWVCSSIGHRKDVDTNLVFLLTPLKGAASGR